MAFDPVLFNGVAQHHNAFDFLLHDHCPEVVTCSRKRSLRADEARLAQAADPVGVYVLSVVEAHSVVLAADHISVAVAVYVAEGKGKFVTKTGQKQKLTAKIPVMAPGVADC